MTVSPKEIAARNDNRRASYLAERCWDCDNLPSPSAVDDVDALLAEIARLRAVTGPDCPKCGHFLKAEHTRSTGASSVDDSFGRVEKWRVACEITAAELLSDHPEIAKEMGLV